MGISERKLREKEQLKELILNAARELFFKQGFEKTSIRNIAESIEYSPGIIYHYFKDKNEIFHTLHTEGFNTLKKKMESVTAIADPMGRLKAMGKQYVQFALENPKIYDLMFMLKAPVEHMVSEEVEGWEEGESIFNLLKLTVREAIMKGYFRGLSAEPLSYMILATLHGLVSLKIRKRTNRIKVNEVDSIVMNSYQAFTLMLDR
ncbi:TetR/AcrR family transcriptional regulator [Shivajiella indica]|uniref:TetR/AcrR family transcriptional regulator n=1 Tax=Shivajiella indica TaxID=872115 RepID=A0ABW5BD70_9BACT